MTREDAVKGLWDVANWHYGKYEQTHEEDYLNDSQFLMAVADMLKAQEPRLLTCADFEANPMLDDDGRLPCWCEDLICDSGWTAVSVGGVLPDHIKANGCRYWTSRPTDAQREATPWNL